MAELSILIMESYIIICGLSKQFAFLKKVFAVYFECNAAIEISDIEELLNVP